MSQVGDTVIFGFRAQAFFTRAVIVPVAGIAAAGRKRRGSGPPTAAPPPGLPTPLAERSEWDKQEKTLAGIRRD